MGIRQVSKITCAKPFERAVCSAAEWATGLAEDLRAFRESPEHDQRSVELFRTRKSELVAERFDLPCVAARNDLPGITAVKLLIVTQSPGAVVRLGARQLRRRVNA